MTKEAMKADDQAPDYRKAMLYHSDRADALMAERDDAMALFHAADKQRQALQAERDALKARAEAAEAALTREPYIVKIGPYHGICIGGRWDNWMFHMSANGQ